VFERVYREAYDPFLGVLAAHPGVRVALHVSGSLLDWLESHRAGYLDRVGTLVDRGQIELLTGAYYEPILPAIPEADRVGQIRKLTDRLERRFGRRPTGMWVAERVWEPALAGSLARAGVAYTFLDDTHFLAAGLSPESLFMPYRTEDLGRGLALYPISKKLRYLIPFRPPEEGIAWLLEQADAHPGGTVVLGDDGEKFGHWPRTYRTVYEERWLDRFFGALSEQGERIRMLFPADALAESPPSERVYLPIASYEEMMEWTLPAEIVPAYEALRRRLAEEGNPALPLVRGGIWRTYLARYPESDHLQKRVLALRDRVESIRERDPDAYARALDALWAAQCNCAYWHGVFGGIYLPHLRDALYRRLLEAEHTIDRALHGDAPWVSAERVDLNVDGDAEILLENPRLSLVIDPGHGGALVELSVKPEAWALGNGLTRRRESYHARVAEAAAAAGSGDPARSIHDRLETKESGLERRLFVDAYRRVSLVDHCFAPDASLDAFARGSFPGRGGFEHEAYRRPSPPEWRTPTSCSAAPEPWRTAARSPWRSGWCFPAPARDSPSTTGSRTPAPSR
jgi:alpha-amylase